MLVVHIRGKVCARLHHEGHILSYANALLRTDSESVETTVRRRRILFAGFVACMGEERLPRRVMFGEMLGGKGYSGGQERGWMKDLEEDLKAFGIKFEGWREAAQNVVSDGSKKGRRFSCGNGTRMRRRQQQGDTGRFQPRL